MVKKGTQNIRSVKKKKKKKPRKNNNSSSVGKLTKKILSSSHFTLSKKERKQHLIFLE